MIVLVQIILVFVGLFAVAGGVFGWEWFMGHWKSRLFVKMFGRNGARAFYVIFGFAVTGLGVLISVMLDGG